MHKIIRRAFLALFIILFILILTLCVLRGLFPLRHYDLIEKYCEEYTVKPYFVSALIKAESNFREDAVSHADAKGLMQLTDATFLYCMETLGKEGDIFSAEDNIQAGVWYLSHLLKKYDGNITNAIAAYNAGSTNVDGWLSDSRYSDDGKTLLEIPFGETDRHVGKIRRYGNIYKFLYPKTKG